MSNIRVLGGHRVLEVDGVRVSFDFLPYLIDTLDGATIVTREGRVIDCRRSRDPEDVHFSTRVPPLRVTLK